MGLLNPGKRESVPAHHRFFGGPHIALEAPAINHFGVEAPVGSDAEPGQLATTQQFVDGRGMNSQISREFTHRHHTRQVVLWISHDIISNSNLRNGTYALTEITALIYVFYLSHHVSVATLVSRVAKKVHRGQEQWGWLSTVYAPL